MPLREDILNPIPGANPSGENLRYAPVYDKIKEARREDEDVAQGDWQRERKVADWVNVYKLTSETLATKSKDLQLAAWLTEAALKREGYAGLLEGLRLIRDLMANFWDTLYPEIEDGDLEFRATPIEWIGTKFDISVKQVPLTKSGLNLFKYRESRTVGYEADAQVSDERMQKRRQDIEDGKITAEEWDSAFNATPKPFYEQTVDNIEACLEILESLNDIGSEKFGEYAPSFSKLREAFEELRHIAKQFLQQKGGRDSDAQVPPEPEPQYESTPSYGSASAAAPARAPVRKASLAAEPADREDAAERIAVVAKYLRQQDPYSPAAFLLLRGFRWGELRANETADPSLLEAPPTEIKVQLKKLATDSSWQELLEASEAAMAMPCGRGWLDLQRYSWKASYEMGYARTAAAIVSELKALIRDMPDLVNAEMADGSQTANKETQTWITETVAPPGEQQAARVDAPYVPRMQEDERGQSDEDSENAVPDAFQLALNAVRSGRKAEAVEILSREVAQERSGRARFQRKMQLAQICMAIGNNAIASPILQELAEDIERLRLENWEAADVIAQPLALLYRCLERGSQDRPKLYARICRLDPVQALSLE